MKFYKKDVSWVIQKRNETNEMYITPSDYILSISNGRISVYRPAYTNNAAFMLFLNENVADIDKNEAGDKYTSVTEFITSVASFFSSATDSQGVEGESGIPTGKTSRLIDTEGAIVYVGYSLVGEPVDGNWDIKKIDSSINPVSVTWAFGTWTSRAGLTYI